MAEKSFAGRALNAAHHLKALKDIIKALLRGGWASAGLQVLKHYWPQVLAAACILLILPVLLMCMVPMTMFGFAGSEDAQIAALSSQAEQVNGYFESYEEDYANRIEEGNEEIRSAVSAGYLVSEEGEDLPKNRFIALFSVHVGNDFTKVNEETVQDFLKKCVVVEVTEPTDETPGAAVLRKLSAEEIMERLDFSESDRSFAEMLYNTLEQGA